MRQLAMLGEGVDVAISGGLVLRVPTALAEIELQVEDAVLEPAGRLAVVVGSNQWQGRVVGRFREFRRQT